MIRPRCTCSESKACRSCFLVAGSQKYAEKWEITPDEVKSIRHRIRRLKRVAKPATKAVPRLPCRYIGARVNVHGSERRWTRCDHPQRVELGIADKVCPCVGCGPRCPGYNAASVPIEEPQ